MKERIIRRLMEVLPAKKIVVVGSCALKKYGLIDKADDIDMVIVGPTKVADRKIVELVSKFPRKKEKYRSYITGPDASLDISGVKVDIWFKDDYESLEIEGIHYGYITDIIGEKVAYDRDKDWDVINKIRSLFPER